MNYRSILPALMMAATPVWTSSPAQAQSATDDRSLEEVVVSARQRSERLVDVPATVQAFTAADIELAGIERPGDFVALTAGLSQVQTAEVGDLQLSIRGLNTGRDSETNFALVVDGVLQTNPNAFNQEFANIQQIEVVKGPQGAIYGRNALAGAVIITTTEPSNTFAVNGKLGTGNRNTKTASGHLSGALSDQLLGSIGAFYRSTDGFHRNSFRNCDDCVDYFKEVGVTPRLILNVGDHGKLDINGKYSKVKAGAINFNAVFALPLFAQFLNSPKFFEDVNSHEFRYISNVIPQNEQTNQQISVKGDWQLGLGTLTSWISFNDQKNFFLTDGTSAAFGLYASTPQCQADLAAQVGGPLPAPTFYAGANSVLPPYSPSRCDGYQYQQRDQKDVSAELRLTSKGDSPLRWSAGIYYADIKRHVVVAQGGDTGRGFLTQAFVPSSGPNPTDLLYDDDFHSKVAAIFGQLAYDVMPGMEAALALRYDSESRSVDNNVPTGSRAFAQTALFANSTTAPYINPAYTANPALASGGIPDRSRRFSQLQPKVSLNWKFIDNWSAYASYGYGFRSGGFNSTGSNATIAQYLGGLRYVTPTGTVTGTPSLTTAGINYDDYNKEVSKAAELGIKAELLNRSLYLNLAAYQTKVDDMQIFNFFVGPFGLLRVVTNVDAVTLSGFEGELRFKANSHVSLFAGVGTVNSKIDRYVGRSYTVGNEVPYAPTYTANAGIDFSWPINNEVTLIARIDANATGKTWFSAVQEDSVQTQFGVPADYSKTQRDAFTLYNARLGIKGEQWSVTLWGRNLADKDYLQEVIPAPEFGGSFVHAASGRATGLELAYRFGN